MTVELRANRETAKVLQNPGKAKGLPGPVHETLVKKLMSVEGKLEQKGRGFYGMDLGSGYRAIFALDAARQPVMVFAGDHRGYDKMSNQISGANSRLKEQFAACDTCTVEVKAKKVEGRLSHDGFSAAFARAVAAATGAPTPGPRTPDHGGKGRDRQCPARP